MTITDKAAAVILGRGSVKLKSVHNVRKAATQRRDKCNNIKGVRVGSVQAARRD